MSKKLWSVFTDDMDHCYFTGASLVERHHIFGGNPNALCELIDAQPIAFDLDKVVEQLEKKIQTHARCIEYEKKNGTITEEFQQRKAVEVLKKAVEIVKGGGVDGKVN